MNALNKKRGLVGMTAILFLGLVACLLSACNDEVDVQQSYPFKVETLPVPTRIVKGETVEIRCELKREGRFSDARYTIRYFQPDGKGTLRMDDGMVLLPNDRYPLDREVFRLYYTSESEDQQTIDIYFEDNSEPAQLCQLTFDFNNETEDEDSVVTADSKELPVTTVRHSAGPAYDEVKSNMVCGAFRCGLFFRYAFKGGESGKGKSGQVQSCGRVCQAIRGLAWREKALALCRVGSQSSSRGEVYQRYYKSTGRFHSESRPP